MDEKLNINPEITINLINFNQSKFLKKAIDITKYQEMGYLNAREMANKV